MGVKFDKSKLTKELIKAITNLGYDRAGRFVVNRIKSEVRKGISPVTGKSFKPLTASTIARRRKLAELNKTNTHYSAGDSNLTFTGQLLNALTYSVRYSGLFNKLIIFTKDSVRKPYKTRLGIKELPQTNLEIQEKVELERPYIGLDKVGEEILKQMLINDLERELKKIKG